MGFVLFLVKKEDKMTADCNIRLSTNLLNLLLLIQKELANAQMQL